MAGDLADILIRTGKLDAQGAERARRLGASTGERFEVVLTRLGLVAEDDLAHALAEHLGLPLVRPEHYPDAALLADRVPLRFLRQARVVPLEDRPEGLALAVADPLDRYALDAMRLLVGKPVEPWVAVPAELAAALDRLYGGAAPASGIAADGAGAVPREHYAEDERRLRDRASDAPVVRIVDALIEDALALRASDIHLEPLADRLRVRLRVDGVLRDVASPPVHLQQAVVNRVKVMAELDIAERRLAQDGRIRANVRGREIDIRVSTVPVQHGESVVLRLLDTARAPLDFDAVGFAADAAATLRALLGLANGIVLVTGPTGSGKTTTLYAGLRLLNAPDVKILTAEDPIEYELPGVNQVQVRPQIGLTFAAVLRSLLRQDPDIMMIGEIRDRETAQIAVQAALTGHLVLSTLHTNDALGAVTRLLDMGVEDYLLAAALRGVVGQRLVRRLCPSCRAPYRPDAVEAATAGAAADAVFHRPVGCPACNGTGFVGRTVIAEATALDVGLRSLILERAGPERLAAQARESGFRSLREDGWRQVRAGVTSFADVLRVTHSI